MSPTTTAGNDELVLDLSDATLSALHARAAKNCRSFNDEVLAILDAAVLDVPEPPPHA